MKFIKIIVPAKTFIQLNSGTDSANRFIKNFSRFARDSLGGIPIFTCKRRVLRHQYKCAKFIFIDGDVVTYKGDKYAIRATYALIRGNLISTDLMLRAQHACAKSYDEICIAALGDNVSPLELSKLYNETRSTFDTKLRPLRSNV